ncbi:cytochrome P450 [Nocardia alni]|uniref:cytochrome P450 n=1 Tax=Nocardia alni TaxID=2815723 RepID=UPI001C226B61|nr:cytochrome P450 [Nocardia alni]
MDSVPKLEGTTEAGVPIYRFDDSARGPVMSHQHVWDHFVRRHTGFRSSVEPGFWVVTDGSDVRRALQDWNTFSSKASIVFDPEPAYQWIPEMLDPPEHREWRIPLAEEFSHAAAARREEEIRQTARNLIEQIVDRGECDVLDNFARLLPTTIFMRVMGFPDEDTAQFLEWTAVILHQSIDDDPDRSKMAAAMEAEAEYFLARIAERREYPGDDLLSKAIGWTIKGEPARDEDLLSFCTLMFLAGIDTVPIQLGYSFYHLATHPADRALINSDPSSVSRLVEEMLRVYAFVNPARRATTEATLGGCPIKAGDMVLLPLSVANRDPARYDNPQEVDVDRAASSHIAFGSGPHRCVGSHLARLELNVAMQEWHARIPDYRLTDDQPPLMQHGTIYGLEQLRLTW